LPAVNEGTFATAHASPAVRKFARELGVDLGRIKGTSAKQRISKEDISAFVKAVMTGQTAASAGAALPEIPHVDFSKFGPIEEKPLGRIQKISGPRLHASWVNIPHITQSDEADITALEARRQALKNDAAERGVKLTPLAFFIRAVVQALQEFPVFNTSMGPDNKSLIWKKYMHIGFAADTPNGLVVPVIRDADKKDLFTIAAELADLSSRARDNKLKVDEMQGGTFTVSSLGGIGGTGFTPIINAPEVAILGIPRSKMQPVWDGQAFVPRLIQPLCLSYDHRVIDGATGVRFTTYLAARIADVDGLIGRRRDDLMGRRRDD
jgi:pyruvate dehydrogenase E2 component (dihydrolipoamide acetyltransferase)